MSIGVDILKISRLEKLAPKAEFLNKLFSQKEIEYFKSRSYNINTVAGAFCAKEALAKAIGCGLSRLPLTEISVVRDELGKPFFEFSEKFLFFRFFLFSADSKSFTCFSVRILSGS